jgi:hypothetical protein
MMLELLSTQNLKTGIFQPTGGKQMIFSVLFQPR